MVEKARMSRPTAAGSGEACFGEIVINIWESRCGFEEVYWLAACACVTSVVGTYIPYQSIDHGLSQLTAGRQSSIGSSE